MGLHVFQNKSIRSIFPDLSVLFELCFRISPLFCFFFDRKTTVIFYRQLKANSQERNCQFSRLFCFELFWRPVDEKLFSGRLKVKLRAFLENHELFLHLSITYNAFRNLKPDSGSTDPDQQHGFGPI